MFIRSLQCSIIIFYCWILLNHCIAYLFEHHKLGVVLVRLLLYCIYIPLICYYNVLQGTIIILATLCTAKLYIIIHQSTVREDIDEEGCPSSTHCSLSPPQEPT